MRISPRCLSAALPNKPVHLGVHFLRKTNNNLLMLKLAAGEADEARYAKLNATFLEVYGSNPDLLARSPGTSSNRNECWNPPLLVWTCTREVLKNKVLGATQDASILLESTSTTRDTASCPWRLRW